MSLLMGRHTVRLATYEESVPDKWGVRKRTAVGTVNIRCTVQWQNAEEAAGVVPQPATAVKVLARDWPGKANDHFMWEGRTFEQVGPAREFTGSPAVRHFEVFARLISDE